MSRNNILTLSGIGSLILACFLGFDDNLSELTPLFVILSMGCFGWLIVRKTRPSKEPTASPTHWLLRLSAIFGVAGLAGIGLGFVGLFVPALEELMAAGIIGLFLLIVAVLARIAGGMLTNRVDAATGVLSISTIMVLLVMLVVIALLGLFFYAILNGLGLI